MLKKVIWNGSFRVQVKNQDTLEQVVHVADVDDAEVVAEVALVDVCHHSDVGSVVRKLELSASIMEYLLSNKIKFITEDYLQAYISITTTVFYQV